MARFRVKGAAAAGALALLTISAVVLSVLALQRNQGVPDNTPTYTYTPDSEAAKPNQADPDSAPDIETDTDVKDHVEQPEPEEEVKVPAPTRFLSLGADGQILRGEYGTCPERPGWSEVSSNGGSDWQPTNADARGAVQILDARIASTDIQELIVLNDSCEPVLLRSYIGGVSWAEMTGMVSDRWFFNPTNSDVISTAANQVESPCEIAQMVVSASRQTGAVLCGNSEIFRSTNQGETWSGPIRAEGAQAISTTDERLILATLDREDCQGIQVEELNGNTFRPIGACIASSKNPEELAIAHYQEEIVIWADDAFHNSQDGGNSWQ